MKRRDSALAPLFLLLACARGLPPLETRPAPEPAVESESAPVATPTPTVHTPPSPAATPAPPVAPEPASVLEIPSRVRVGLATDRSRIVIPCCSTRLVIFAGEHRIAVESATLLEPGGAPNVEPIYRLQAAALRAEAQARALAERLGGLLDTSGEVVFEATDGLYRVRVGTYSSREEADSALDRLERLGVEGAWVTSEQPRLARPIVKITQKGRQWVAGDRWVRIVPAAGAAPGVPVDGKRYRGELLVYLNDRGLLNLINRVTLDDYLRGVVPREMGPELYDDVEALKAQAVAARTYTLRNLGEFRAEGFDICATPRCQVYGGIGSEHALSDRAVRETAGEVLVARDRFADALYSSTCGGHTEDVEVVFPLKDHSYLRGVPCLEGSPARLGDSSARRSLEQSVLDQLGLAEPGVGAKDSLNVFTAGAVRLARQAGLASSPPAPERLDRRELTLFLARLLAIEPVDRPAGEADARLEQLVSRYEGWETGELRLAARLMNSGLMENRLARPPDAAELTRMLYRLAVYLGRVEKSEARYLELRESKLRVKRWGAEEGFEWSAGAGTFHLRRGQLEPAVLTLMAGDPLTLYSTGSRLLAVARPAATVQPVAPRPSRYRSWQHFRSDQELERLVDVRYPGLGFRHLEVLSRGVSGRVAALRLTGHDGQQVEITGLPIRWTLDLPDTLFTARKTASRSGAPGWLFSGRGWGHGVGMCQVGAFGMARRGHVYRDILAHYYTGLELRKVGEATDSLRPAP